MDHGRRAQQLRLRNQLSHKVESPESGRESGIVITFHGYGQIGVHARPLAEPFVPDFRIIVLESPRPAMWFGRANDGRSWYNHQGITKMETGTFGDGLAQVEQFLIDTVRDNTNEDGSRPSIYLAGIEQGAAMALSIATIWPDVLAGVVAVCGHVPEPAGWTPDTRPMKGLPVLMIHDPEFTDINDAVLESTRLKLQELGASLEEQWWAGAMQSPKSTVELIRNWKETVMRAR